nr:hypothetical protein [Fodinicola feengrottensis]
MSAPARKRSSSVLVSARAACITISTASRTWLAPRSAVPGADARADRRSAFQARDGDGADHRLSPPRAGRAQGLCDRRPHPDPEIIADDSLRQPVDETLRWLRGRLAEVLAQGRDQGEIAATLDPAATATAVVAVLQGGYVLARAAGSAEPFTVAVDGILGLLASA